MANHQVEDKVKWSSMFTYLAASAGLAVAQAFTDAGMVGALPNPLEPFILAVLPAVVNFLSGYVTRHTYRDEW